MWNDAFNKGENKKQTKDEYTQIQQLNNERRMDNSQVNLKVNMNWTHSQVSGGWAWAGEILLPCSLLSETKQIVSRIRLYPGQWEAIKAKSQLWH